MIDRHVERYLASRALTGPWTFAGIQGERYAGAVVIPSLAESRFLFSTLHSLAHNPPDLLSRFLILVVVNHRQDASPSEKADNQETLRMLSCGEPSLAGLQLAWVDAASPGLELPAKTGGVGMARKIGFDLALTHLNYGGTPPILISLDADTLCRPNYFSCIVSHFQGKTAHAAVIPFRHQLGATMEEDQAIRRYELFLRAYVLGLSRAGSPYAFHAVGSAMACTAEGYARIGGMNRRSAGEDFYFLQQMAKTGGISQVKGTVVYPSARTSHRVPFGTGRSMTDLLSRKEGVVLFYRAECFQILARWLALVAQSLGLGGKEIQEKTLKFSSDLFEFLKENRFEFIWEKLQRNFPASRNLWKGFHDWFDGLKTMKLIHHLSAGPYPRKDPELVMPEFLVWAGLEPVEGIGPQLELLRKIQIDQVD